MKEWARKFIVAALVVILLTLVGSILFGFTPGPKPVDSYQNGGIIFTSQSENEKNYLGIADFQGEEYYSWDNIFIVRPVWSKNDVIFGLTGWKYFPEVMGYPMYWDLKTNKWSSCERETFEYIQSTGNQNPPYEVIVADNQRIHILDFGECEITRVLVEKDDLPDYTEVSSISYHPESSVLVYGLIEDIDQEKQQYSIHTWNLETGEKQQVSSTGLLPSISPSGGQIAFYTDQGISVMDIDGSNMRLLIEKKFFQYNNDYFLYFMFHEPVLNWSSDGKFLIYHYCDDEGLYCHLSQPETIQVMEVDIEKGTENVLFTGGLYPFWKSSSE